jgi:hypothetical protein
MIYVASSTKIVGLSFGAIFISSSVRQMQQGLQPTGLGTRLLNDGG